jgi:D-arabinose 1-dehydrogenase-like Zn-dependent alcohol dehydrogenase
VFGGEAEVAQLPVHEPQVVQRHHLAGPRSVRPLQVQDPREQLARLGEPAGRQQRDAEAVDGGRHPVDPVAALERPQRGLQMPNRFVTASQVDTRGADAQQHQRFHARVAVSGVDPIDFKLRQGEAPLFPEVVPHNDGAGTVDARGDGVTELEAGQLVWLWEVGYGRPGGTAQEHVVVPAKYAVPLPDDASFELGASIGIPAVTARRALTVHEDSPARLTPGSLAGRTVLVAGGAGAVGHATIQLARWAGARVIATVSTGEKAKLALAAGAERWCRTGTRTLPRTSGRSRRTGASLNRFALADTARAQDALEQGAVGKVLVVIE